MPRSIVPSLFVRKVECILSCRWTSYDLCGIFDLFRIFCEPNGVMRNGSCRVIARSGATKQSGCVVIRFSDGRIQYIVGVRFIEPDITGLMNQALRYDMV